MDTKYIIGAFSNGKAAQPYLDSLKLLGDSVEVFLIQYLRNGKFDKVKLPDNAKLIKYKKNYAGNTGKHKDFRELIAPLLEKDTWCIFTDVHDIAFQTTFPEFPDDADILVATEAKKFGEITYWKEIFPREVWEWEVFNVGCFAMKRDTLLEFWDYLYDNWINFYHWYKEGSLLNIGDGVTFPFAVPRFHQQFRVELAMLFNSNYDTLCYNRFLRTKKIKEVKGLFGCYAYQVEMGKITDSEGKLYVDNELISIAHFNGSMKIHMRNGVKWNKYVRVN